MGTLLLPPVGNGSVNAWSAFGASTTWEAVDDAPTTEGDGDATYMLEYVYNSATNFTFTAPSFDLSTIITGVRVNYRAARNSTDNNATLGSRIWLGDGGLGASAQNTLINDGVYRLFSDLYTVNPSTFIAWAPEDINQTSVPYLLYFGVIANDITPFVGELRVTQCYLSVEHGLVYAATDTSQRNVSIFRDCAYNDCRGLTADTTVAALASSAVRNASLVINYHVDGTYFAATIDVTNNRILLQRFNGLYLNTIHSVIPADNLVPDHYYKILTEVVDLGGGQTAITVRVTGVSEAAWTQVEFTVPTGETFNAPGYFGLATDRSNSLFSSFNLDNI